MTILAKKVMDEGWLNIFMRPYFTRRVAAEFFLQKFYTIYKCAESSKRNTVYFRSEVFKLNNTVDYLINAPFLINASISNSYFIFSFLRAKIQIIQILWIVDLKQFRWFFKRENSNSYFINLMSKQDWKCVSDLRPR